MVLRLPVPQLLSVLLLLLFCSPAFAATTVSSCANLSLAGETYTLNQSVSVNGASCFNITAENVTLDCAGHSVVGNNASGTYGAYSNKRNTTIKNCDITKFQVGVYFLAATSSSILNSSLYADATMPLCSSYEYSECTHHAGCSTISFCSDGGQCEAITDESGCLTAGDGLSCSWNGSACHRLNDCPLIGERGPCEYYLCTWTDSCAGTQSSCAEQNLCRAIDIVNSSSTGISGVNTNTTKGLRIVSSSSVSVSDSSFVSNVSTAISVEASIFSTFSNVNSSSVESFALFINNSNSGIFNSLRALSTNLQAVRFYYSSNNNVSNSNISNNHPTFDGGGYSAFNMDHSGNNTINSTYLYSSGGVGIVSDNSIDNNYSNLTIRTKEDVCIFLLGSSNRNRISNNDLYSLNNTPVRIVDSLYNLVEHSVLRSDTASAMCIMDSGNNNTFNNITANSTGPAWAGVSACKHMAGIAIDSSRGNIIANSTISGNSSLVFLLANGSANTLYNSRLISASGNQTLVHINGTSSNNTFYQNNLTGRIWVNDSGTSNHYNSSAYGNIYYFANGTPSWKVFDIRDTDGQGWADAGSAVPFNNTTVSGYWYGNGADYKPYVPARAFGNSSNVSTTYSNVSITIGNDTNSTGKYLEGNYSVNFSSNSQPILLFDFNFSAAALNFSQINITNGTSGGAAFAQNSGINYSGLIGGKTIYLYNASESYNYVCVKDEEGASALSITSGCSGGNETLVPCNGSNSGYSCNRSGTTLTVTGLNHSALIQYQPASPSTQPSGGSGSYITPSLAYSFNCSSGMLEIAARYSGSPISNLEIKLFMGGTTDFVKSKTGPAGKAQFNITQSRKYYLQSAQDSIYLFAELPSFQLTLCQSTEPSQPNASQQPSANATQSASAPCASYSYESCPSSCVVCPPCAVCSSISCQTEEFCAGMGFSRGWYGSIKPVVGAIKNQTSSQQGAAQQQTGSQSQSTGAQGNLPSQSQQGAQQQSGAAASGTGAQPALALAASGTILVVIIIATLGIAYFVFFRKRKGL